MKHLKESRSYPYNCLSQWIPDGGLKMPFKEEEEEEEGEEGK